MDPDAQSLDDLRGRLTQWATAALRDGPTEADIAVRDALATMPDTWLHSLAAKAGALILEQHGSGSDSTGRARPWVGYALAAVPTNPVTGYPAPRGGNQSPGRGARLPAAPGLDGPDARVTTLYVVRAGPCPEPLWAGTDKVHIDPRATVGDLAARAADACGLLPALGPFLVGCVAEDGIPLAPAPSLDPVGRHFRPTDACWVSGSNDARARVAAQWPAVDVYSALGGQCGLQAGGRTTRGGSPSSDSDAWGPPCVPPCSGSSPFAAPSHRPSSGRGHGADRTSGFSAVAATSKAAAPGGPARRPSRSPPEPRLSSPGSRPKPTKGWRRSPPRKATADPGGQSGRSAGVTPRRPAARNPNEIPLPKGPPRRGTNLRRRSQLQAGDDALEPRERSRTPNH